MTIYKRDPAKYFIETVIINDNNNPGIWNEEKLNKITNGHIIVGYLFTTKNGAFNELGHILNLYLINKKYYRKDIITLEMLKTAYHTFLVKCKEYTDPNQYAKRNVFQNPPIEEWLRTKDNWCKKIAHKIMEFGSYTMLEAMSEIYNTIVRLYNKPHVYMGNLSYVQTAIFNDLKMSHRKEKVYITGNNENVMSLDAVIEVGKDSDAITLYEIIGIEDSAHREQDYKDFENDCRELLRTEFSDREITQIFTQKAGYLPMNIYRRLLNWRANNKDLLDKLRGEI